MAVYLTSFFKIKELPEGVEPFSAAVYQPKGYNLEKPMWTDIRQDGKWTRPRNFLEEDDPAEAYFEAMLKMYRSREVDARWWLQFVMADKRDVALCCWCPYDRAARRQLEEFGTFICHTGPLGTFIEELGYDVLYDEDRLKMYGP